MALARHQSVIAKGPNIRKAQFQANNKESRESLKITQPISKEWESSKTQVLSDRKDEEDENHLTRNTIFALKFLGKKVPDDQVFRNIKAYSPCGFPKTLPYTNYNKMRYQKYLEMKEE